MNTMMGFATAMIFTIVSTSPDTPVTSSMLLRIIIATAFGYVGSAIGGWLYDNYRYIMPKGGRK
jgi:hypothetical protein